MRMRAFSPVCRWILGALCSLAADLAGAQAVEPLPALRVEDGVLVDANGREVALWGVNYQASLSWEYGETFSRVGIPLEAGPLKRAVDQDLAHFKRMGVSVVRVHISPSDFTDAEGKLVDTVFLDVFDYLVARCREEGLYVFLSLFNRIGQYDHANFLKDSFASKGGINGTVGQPDKRPYIFCPEFVEPLRTYVRELLIHRNRYDGATLKEDPGVALWEIINEPEYVEFKDIGDPKFAAYRNEWERWLERNGREATEETFAEFRGKYVAKFIDDMVDLVRSEGARQPIAWSMNWPRFMEEHPDVHRALPATKVDAVTFCLYLRKGLPPKGQINWFDMPDISSVNQLRRILPSDGGKDEFAFVRDPALRGKAKVVYEFETVNNDSAYLYPAMARFFRELGAQIACMWEYDPLVAAEENCVPTHFLNYHSSPRKAVSFLIASEAFRTLPRGPTPGFRYTETGAVFSDFGVSFDGDISVHVGRDTVMASNDWSKWPREMREFRLPEANRLRRVVGIGNGPFAEYEGTGLYQMDIGDDRIELEITPNVARVGKLWAAEKHGTRAPKAIQLDEQPRRFTLRLKGWEHGVTVRRIGTDEEVPLSQDSPPTFPARPGRYLLTNKVPAAVNNIDIDQKDPGSESRFIDLPNQETQIVCNVIGEAVRSSDFHTTHWTLIVASCDVDRERGFDYIYRTYSRPLRGYLRRFGIPEDDADDVLHEFLLAIFHGGTLARADPARGKFRSYLLGALNHFVANRRERNGAARRGGGVPDLPLDDLALGDTPGSIDDSRRFDEDWARALFDRAVERLNEELDYHGSPAGDLRELIFRDQDGTYAEIAASLRITVPAVKSRIFRLRKRFQEIIRQEVRRTVDSDAECEEELSYLCSVLSHTCPTCF